MTSPPPRGSALGPSLALELQNPKSSVKCFFTTCIISAELCAWTRIESGLSWTVAASAIDCDPLLASLGRTCSRAAIASRQMCIHTSASADEKGRGWLW